MSIFSFINSFFNFSQEKFVLIKIRNICLPLTEVKLKHFSKLYKVDNFFHFGRREKKATLCVSVMINLLSITLLAQTESKSLVP